MAQRHCQRRDVGTTAVSFSIIDGQHTGLV